MLNGMKVYKVGNLIKNLIVNYLQKLKIHFQNGSVLIKDCNNILKMSIKQMFIHWRNITSYKRYDKWCQDLNINMYV